MQHSVALQKKKKKKFDCRSLLFYVITVNLLEINFINFDFFSCLFLIVRWEIFYVKK